MRILITRILLACNFLVLAGLPLFAELPALVPYYHNGLWGYSDTTGHIVVEPAYRSAERLQNGLGIVSITDSSLEDGSLRPLELFGIVDSRGSQVSPPVFSVKPEVEDAVIITALRLSGRDYYGMLHHNGDTILPFAHDSINRLADDLWLAHRPDQEPPLLVYGPERQVREGNILYLNAGQFVNDYAITGGAGRKGLMNMRGELLIDTLFHDLAIAGGDFVFFKTVRGRTVYWGCLNLRGDTIAPPRYHKLKMLSDHLLAARMNPDKGISLFELYDKDGRLESQPLLHQAINMSQGRVRTERERGWVTVDTLGTMYQHSRWEFPQWRGNTGDRPFDAPSAYKGTISFRTSLGSGRTNYQGQFLSSGSDHDQLLADSLFKGRFVEWTNNSNSENWPNEALRKRILAQVDRAYMFNQGWAPFKRDDKSGLIDTNGRELFYGQFEGVSVVRHGVAKVHNRYYPPPKPQARRSSGFEGDLLPPCDNYFNRRPMYSPPQLYNCGYVDTSGKQLSPVEFSECKYFSGNRALFRQRSDSLYGFIDWEGRIAIPPIYRDARSFRDGQAVLKLEYWGAVDTNGHTVIPFVYDSLGIFREGLAPVARDDEWTYLDRRGREIRPPQFQSADTMRFGLGRVRIADERLGCVNKYGTIVLNVEAESLDIWTEDVILVDKRRLFNSRGQEIPVGDYSQVKRIADNLAAFEADGAWGIIDFNGKVLRKAVYQQIGKFRGGLVPVQRGRWTFLNRSLEEVVPPQFRQCRSLDSGYGLAQLPREIAVRNESGQVIQTFYDTIPDGEYIGGMCRVRHGRQFAFMNRSGKVVMPALVTHSYSKPVHHIVTQRFSNAGYANVKIGGNYTVIDTLGNIVVVDTTLTAYLTTQKWLKNQEWISAPLITLEQQVREGKKLYGLYHPQKGRITPIIWESIGRFSEGLAVVQHKKRYGFIDTNGRLVCKPRFDFVGEFVNGYAVAGYRKAAGVIDRKGRFKTPPTFYFLYQPKNFSGRAYLGRRNDEYFLCDERGDIVHDLEQYDEHDLSVPNHIRVKRDGRYGLVDVSGRLLVPPLYIDVGTPVGGLIPVRLDNAAWVYIDYSGRRYWTEN